MVRVYIVEDNSAIQDLYVMYLTKMGHEIIGQSYNGIEALVELYFKHRQNPPDLLILDNAMPGKNGLELLNDLHQLDYIKNTKVLFISGSDYLQFPALEMGILKFIQKPFDYQILSETIKDLVSEETKISI